MSRTPTPQHVVIDARERARRHVPGRALPRNAYVPGRGPRPIAVDEAVARFAPIAWETSEDYAWGFDLLNHGFPWEAHEIWESGWRAVERASVEGLLLQALIKVAAAHVKILQADLESSRRHAMSAAEIVSRIQHSIAPKTDLMGVDLEALAASAREVATTGVCAHLRMRLPAIARETIAPETIA